MYYYIVVSCHRDSDLKNKGGFYYAQQKSKHIQQKVY